MQVSVIIPIYNEESNIPIIYREFKKAFLNSQLQYELIFINDGSSDNSLSILENIKYTDNSVKIISFDKNYGQTAALDAGFKNAKGEIVLTIDGDLQYNPLDLIRIIKELQNDAIDVVLGRRFIRSSGLIRVFSSKIANLVRNKILKENYQDCALAGYRKKCLDNLRLYDGLQYFIPVLLKMDGYDYKEIDVNEFPRKYGKSKYNNIIGRLVKGWCMLFAVKWLKENKLRYIIVKDEK